MNKCPGQAERKISSQSIICAVCQYPVEIFSDEIQTRCPKCKKLVYQKILPTCIAWCQAARECVGEEKWKQFSQPRLKA